MYRDVICGFNGCREVMYRWEILDGGQEMLTPEEDKKIDQLTRRDERGQYLECPSCKGRRYLTEEITQNQGIRVKVLRAVAGN